jgi:hypothetical protein
VDARRTEDAATPGRSSDGIAIGGCGTPRHEEALMDDNRFDAFTRLLGASIARRGTLGGLAALGLLAANLASGEAKRKKGKKGRKGKKKRPKPRPLCPKDALDRCAEPVLETLVASTASCRTGCDDPASAACLSCLDPAVEVATSAIMACLEQTCRGGTGPAEAGDEATAETARAARAVAAEAASCNSAAYDTCIARSNRDLATCLIKEAAACDQPRSCLVNLGACVVESRNRASDCIADHGCKGGGYCKQNVCCPHWADTVCNGACCATNKCEQCVNGACKGCSKGQVCTVSPAQVRTCRCLRNLEECGDKCCDHFACEECALVDGVGTCFAGCTPPKVCKRGAFTGSCECPPGTKECGETCCDEDKCETCGFVGGVGTCFPKCLPSQSCDDGECFNDCPEGGRCIATSECCGNYCCPLHSSFFCCHASGTCMPGGSFECGDTCCLPDRECKDGICCYPEQVACGGSCCIEGYECRSGCNTATGFRCCWPGSTELSCPGCPRS